MSHTVRRVEYADLEGWGPIGVAAFGGKVPEPPTPEAYAHQPGRRWASFEGTEMHARLLVLGVTSWFHGRRVPTACLAGVAVAPEQRGRGLLRPLLEAAHREAVERGEVVATLYPTAPGIYRGAGYEVIGSFDDVELPLADLARLRPAPGVTTRRASEADVPALEELYGRWAAAQNGPLTRAEPPFAVPAADWLRGCTGITVAEEDGRLTGAVSWHRGEGYLPLSAIMQVEDLLALTPAAAGALWAFLGSFSSVVGRVRVSTSGMDPAWLVLPGLNRSVARSRPYMLRVLDVAGALEGATLAPLTGQVPFTVTGAGLDGAYLLDVADGSTSCVRTEASDGEGPALSAQGLALLYAGAQSAANLRAAGMLTGPATHDALLTGLFGGRQVHVRDAF